MKGFRLVALGMFTAMVPAGLHYLLGINWTDYVSPTIAPIVIGGLTVVLRCVTDSPVFRKYS